MLERSRRTAGSSNEISVNLVAGLLGTWAGDATLLKAPKATPCCLAQDAMAVVTITTSGGRSRCGTPNTMTDLQITLSYKKRLNCFLYCQRFYFYNTFYSIFRHSIPF